MENLGPLRGKHVVVIGGGLTGLVVAHRLVERAAQVTLLESAPIVGGQIRTERVDDCIVEHGAEGFVARSEAIPALAAELGLGGELMGQSTQRSLGYQDDGLRELAPGEAGALLGLQVPEEDLGKGIRSLRRGMGSLVEALERRLHGRAQVLCASPVEAVERTASGLAVVRAGAAAVTADHVVVTTSARTASQLLWPVAGDAARALASAPTLSSVTVTLAYAKAVVPHPLDATGFVVAVESQRDGLRACTFVTSKFAERARSDTVLLRMFFRPGLDDLANFDDAAWATRAHDAAMRILGVTAAPRRAWVSCWPDALPVHTPAHKALVATLELHLELDLHHARISLAGSAFHGAGMDASVRSAETAADSVR